MTESVDDPKRRREAERKVKSALSVLQQSVTNLRCSDVRELLEGLGFEVRDGAKQGHKVVHHEGIVDFFGTNYTCGHGANPVLKPCYPRTLRQTISRYEEELINYVEKNMRSS